MESSSTLVSPKTTRERSNSTAGSNAPPAVARTNCASNESPNTSTYPGRIARSFEASITVKQRLLGDGQIVAQLGELSGLLIEAIRNGNKPILFGNGGSAADAQHIAAEFVGRFAFDRPALPALALSVNTSCVTAIGNDYGYDLVFARQIEALARPGDIAIGISTSGNSESVRKGLETARQNGLITAALTGETGGKLRGVADYCLSVPSRETPRIQECHILIGHVLAQLVEEEIFGAESCLPRS